MTDRNTMRFESADTWEDACQFTKDENGKLVVAVSEEQAVDSYNRMFECTIHLEPEQATALALWLIKTFQS